MANLSTHLSSSVLLGLGTTVRDLTVILPLEGGDKEGTLSRIEKVEVRKGAEAVMPKCAN